MTRVCRSVVPCVGVVLLCLFVYFVSRMFFVLCLDLSALKLRNKTTIALSSFVPGMIRYISYTNANTVLGVEYS